MAGRKGSARHSQHFNHYVNQDIENVYNVKEVLGTGSFSEVSISGGSVGGEAAQRKDDTFSVVVHRRFVVRDIVRERKGLLNKPFCCFRLCADAQVLRATHKEEGKDYAVKRMTKEGDERKVRIEYCSLYIPEDDVMIIIIIGVAMVTAIIVISLFCWIFTINYPFFVV